LNENFLQEVEEKIEDYQWKIRSLNYLKKQGQKYEYSFNKENFMQNFNILKKLNFFIEGNNFYYFCRPI